MLSFTTITDRQGTQLLIPSIISTLGFSKLSQKVSVTIQTATRGRRRLTGKASISLFPCSYLVLTFNKQKN